MGLLRSKEVLETSVRLAHGTKYTYQLSKCDARFEISLRDIKQIQANPKTLFEIRAALQELTHGFAYDTWDKTLSEPK